MWDVLITKISEFPILFVLINLVSILIGAIISYLVIRNNLQTKFEKILSSVDQKRHINDAIITNSNLGFIAYYKDGEPISNDKVLEFPGFIKGGRIDCIPRDINAFLDAYDKDNQLKATYLLNVENDDIEIRVNYTTENKIYEIKIIHREISNERFDIVIVDDITQIKDDERRQKDLAANVSHELKTPLTVIRGSDVFIKSLRPDAPIKYDEVVKWGTRVINNAVRMQDLINDFLMLSLCQVNTQNSLIEIPKLIDRTTKSIADYPKRDTINLTVNAEPNLPMIYGTENLVARVIENLLTNAIKYNSYPGKTEPNQITMTVSRIDDRIAFMVEDNGRGIPDDAIDHLFERFYRVDTSGNSDVGGSGIGLAIAKEVADMHNGTITVVSKLGKGSSFTFTMPIAEAVFENIFDDAVANIVSDNPYFMSAADYIAQNAVEAIKSMGYDDVLDIAEAFERLGVGEKANHDKLITALISKLGKERFDDLVEEITYIDYDEQDSTFGLYEDEDIGLADVPEDPIETAEAGDIQPATEIVEDGPTPEEIEEENKRLQEIQKEEARKILTQTILPRNPSQANPSQNVESAKESVTIHPNNDKTLYNNKSGKKKTLFEGLTNRGTRNEKPAETGERQSAVKMMLDEAELGNKPAESGD